MTSLICRNLFRLTRKASLISSARAYSDEPYINPHKGKTTSSDISMPDPLGHAVGAERFELLGKLAGEEDPFEMKIHDEGEGTVASPTVVTSIYDQRVICCICDEDAVYSRYMVLNKGTPTRCHCGYYFQLHSAEHKDVGQV